MRITNNMLTRNYTNNLNDNLSVLTNYQTQLSSLKRITKLSDDPIGSMKSMRINAKIYKTDQYKEIVGTAKTMLTDEQNALSDLNEILKSAYEKTVEAANGFVTSEQKTAFASFIKQLRDESLTLGNSMSGEQYIFGGYNTKQPPFTVDASGKLLYNGLDVTDTGNAGLIAEDGQAISLEIGSGLTMEVTMSGTEFMSMGSENVYTMLDGLYKDLQSGATPQTISSYISRLQSAQSRVLSKESEVGGKINRMDLVANRYENNLLNYKSVKSDIEDIDVAEVTLQYQNAQAVYEAALAVGSKIIMPSLVDYLT